MWPYQYRWHDPRWIYGQRLEFVSQILRILSLSYLAYHTLTPPLFFSIPIPILKFVKICRAVMVFLALVLPLAMLLVHLVLDLTRALKLKSVVLFYLAKMNTLAIVLN